LGNSTIKLLDVVDDTRRFSTLAPIFASGGSATQPAVTIANEVMQFIFSPTQPWKFNRFKLPIFYTNSYQQDYALLGLTNLGYLEHGFAVDINNSAIPKPLIPVEVVRDQEQSYSQYGTVAIASSLPNSQLYYGTWGAADTGNSTLGNNPQAHQIITNPLGLPSQPANPITQIQDVNGNLLVLTTYGTTGSSAPAAPANSLAGVTVTDGSVVWTVVSPTGQGIRINPLPSQTQTCWQVNLIGQARPPVFTSLGQTLSPITDDLSHMFTDGFRAYSYRYSPEAKVRAMFAGEFQYWSNSINVARKSQTREKEEFGFYPSNSIMGGGSSVDPGPAWPFGAPAGGS
jgi:hypothetical protein